MPRPAVLLALASLAACAPSSPPAVAPPAAPTGTLVVSNMNDHTVTILDAATGRVHATLPTGQGPHEMAVSHDGRLAVVTDYGVRGAPGSTLTVIDVPRASVTRTLTLAGFQRPHGAAFLPGDTLVAVTVEAQQAVILVDVRDGRVADTLATRGRASHMLALPAGAERAFTANIADGTVSSIPLRGADSTRLFRVARVPEGIAVTPDGASLWVGSNRDSVVLVLDARTGAARDTLRGFGMPYRIAISADGATAVVTDPVKAEVRVFAVADRRERHRVAVPADSLVPTAEVPGSPSPEGVAISRDGRWAFVTLQGRNRVATIDLATGRIVALAPTGTWSDGVAWSPVVVGRP